MHASAPITGLRFLSAIATAAVASRLAHLRHLIKNLNQFIYRSRRAVRFEFQTASAMDFRVICAIIVWWIWIPLWSGKMLLTRHVTGNSESVGALNAQADDKKKRCLIVPQKLSRHEVFPRVISASSLYPACRLFCPRYSRGQVRWTKERWRWIVISQIGQAQRLHWETRHCGPDINAHAFHASSL